jgi:sugar phosphate permease
MSWLAAPAAIAVAIPFIGGAAVGYIGIYLLLGVGGPLTSELLHSRVGASQRTTMLSVESLALQAGGVVSNLLLGTLVVATSAGAGFLVIAVCLLAAGALLFGIPDRPKVETPQMDGRATTEPA